MRYKDGEMYKWRNRIQTKLVKIQKYTPQLDTLGLAVIKRQF